MVNADIFLGMAVILFAAFMIFYAADDYTKKKAMVELMEDTNNLLRNIMLELKKEKWEKQN